ncbi:MAG: flagellar biosynthesis anti-sigma factor FlgM [Thermodesulfobacteriota bacterium]
MKGVNHLNGRKLNSGLRKSGKQEAAANSSESPQPQRTIRSDRVHLSEKNKKFGYLIKIIQEMPEVRTAKVETLKKCIQEGTYKIDSFRVAGKILEEI